MSLKKEIAQVLKFFHTHPDFNLSYISNAEQIVKLFEKHIDNAKSLEELKKSISL